MPGREEMSRSFGAAAGAYEAGRPEYPIDAVGWMLEPAAEASRSPRIADVGAGTGKLTRALVAAGADVVAVDPDAEMLAMLRSRVPGVPALLGTAEHLPLSDDAVDGVVLGQAWHWVDVDAASAEIGRVLRPGGVLGLVWNIRDETMPWVAELTAAMRGSHAEQMLADEGVRVAPPFATLEHEVWRWTRTMDRAALIDMVASRSYVITAAEHERDEIFRRVHDLFDAARRVHDGVDVVDVPYRTEAFRAIRP